VARALSDYALVWRASPGIGGCTAETRILASGDMSRDHTQKRDHPGRAASEGHGGVVSELVARNVRAIADLEEAARVARKGSDRVADAIARFCGSMSFVYLHIVLYGGWMLLNVSPWERLHWDPYPFGLLTGVASMEAIFIGTFILIKHNRQMRLADRRHHLDLQIGMLAEQEVTKVLEMVEALHDRLIGSRSDPEVAALKAVTDPDKVAEHIDRLVQDPA
jgi:uncharacterized membrane protein